jgi:uncharacterized membrane protein YphA (DoxX/SURF4 family)
MTKAGSYQWLPSTLLLPLRVFLGATFVYAGVQHLTDPSYFDPSRPGFIGRLITQYALGSPLHDFLLSVVEPHAVSFGYLVATGEILIGLAVIFGLLFRVACVAGLALNLTFFLSATWTVFPFYFGSDIVFAVGWLTLLLTGPQANMSIDGVLSRRFTSLSWLISGSSAIPKAEITQPEKPPAQAPMQTLQVPSKAGLYPKQVREVNSSFNRIKEQFLGNEETQTVLEMLRVFVISLGVDRKDSVKVLDGITNTLNRDAWQQETTERSE